MTGAPVDRHQHVPRDRPLPRLCVRQRAVRARGHDRGEARRLRSELAHRRLEHERDVALGAPHEAAFQHPFERGVGELAGRCDQRDLGLFLDQAKPLDQPGARDERPAFAERGAERAVRADRQLLLVEPEPAVLPAEQPRQRVAQLAGHGLDRERAVHLLGRLERVAEVGEEAMLTVARSPDQHERVAAGEARQVAHVDRSVHEQRVEVPLLDLARQSFDTTGRGIRVEPRGHRGETKRSRSSSRPSR